MPIVGEIRSGVVKEPVIVVPDITIPDNAKAGTSVRWSKVTGVTDDDIVKAADWFCMKYGDVARDKIVCYDHIVNALIDVIIQVNPNAASADRGDLKCQIMKVGKNGRLSFGHRN